MNRNALKLAVSAAIALSLAACGGGDGRANGIASIPAAQPSAPPPPPATKVPFGVTSDTQFVTVGEDVEFRWIDSAKAYEIQFPGQSSDRLTLTESASTFERHRAPSGYYISLTKTLPYQYTGLADHWESVAGDAVGLFAYGIPTSPANVPTTGTASYSAQIFGLPGSRSGQAGYEMEGDAKLTFDFGAGSLTGYMHPILSDAWFEYDLGRYDFTQAVYSSGSTIFSGKFSVPGGGSTANSGFDGRFTGPNAAELLAQFHAPFRDPASNQWAIMSGVWIGKKD